MSIDYRLPTNLTGRPRRRPGGMHWFVDLSRTATSKNIVLFLIGFKSGFFPGQEPANSSSHTDWSWCVKELIIGVATIGVRSLLRFFTTRIQMDDFIRRRRLRPCRTLKGWSPKPGSTSGIKGGWVSDLYPAMRSSRRQCLCKECGPKRSNRSSYGSRLKPSPQSAVFAPNNRRRQ